MTFTWQRHGGYEVSSQGDTRFSAMYAIMPDGRSLESWYQCDQKGYDPGGSNWRLGKGKPPLNPAIDLWASYLGLWRLWASIHINHMEELRVLATAHNKVLSDCFAKTPVNQAHALAAILNETTSLF